MDSSKSFALNCQFVIGLMQIVDGSAKAGTLLTFLDLPHSLTFQRHTFPKVQLAIHPEIKRVSDKSMSEARDEEVKATIGG